LYWQVGGFQTNDLVVAESSTLSVRRHFEDTQRRSDGAYALQSPQFQAFCWGFPACSQKIPGLEFALDTDLLHFSARSY
jgi:hypothetical protein